jgi:UDP-N-acetylglucosamine transferase subunit ALG13
MIFVTVGSQLPFDRLVKAVDEVAPSFPDQHIIAQVFGMKYQPRNIKTLDYISPADFKDYINAADLIISHAGTGTILSVSQLQKPLIVFPRLGKLKETRNDHQPATCRMLEKVSSLQVAYDEKQLKEKINAFFRNELPVMERIAAHASPQLINSIRSFIESKEEFTTRELLPLKSVEGI